MPGEAMSNHWNNEVMPVKVNWSRGEVTLVPLAVVTVTSTVLTVWTGLTAVRVVSFTTVKLAAGVAPNLTLLSPRLKPVPVIVTLVPPPDGPVLGETLFTIGRREALSGPTVKDHV